MLIPYRRWTCCILVCCAATACGQHPQPIQPVNGPDFSELVGIAERYGLPLPPKHAILVLGNTEGITPLGSSSTSDDPGIYQPAFLLERLRPGPRHAFWWAGRRRWLLPMPSTSRRPAPLARRPETGMRGYVLECNTLSAFVTAVQLARCRCTGRRQKTVGASEGCEIPRRWGPAGERRRTASHPPHPAGTLPLSVPRSRDARQECRPEIFYEKLAASKRSSRFCFSDDPHRFDRYRRSRFVRDLGRAVLAPQAAEASVEALLIDWGNRTGNFRHLGFFNDYDVEADRPAREIFRRGLKALPDLVGLADDQRLTRHFRPALNNAPEDRLRLGDLAQRLLAEMSGSQHLQPPQSLGNGAEAERIFFEKAAVASTPAGIAGFHDVPLWILGELYPRSLLVLCSKIPAAATAAAPLFSLADAIADSKLARQEKADALVGLCTHLTDYRRQRYALQRLARLDEPRCVTLLRPILAKLPRDANEPYWTCEAAYYTQVVMELHDDETWKEYLAIAKRAAVGLKLEMLKSMNYSYIGDTNRGRRLVFLAAFLEDATVRDMAADSFKYDGPCAAYTIETIEVRDFAAMQIASLFDFDDRPTEFWTKDQWAQFCAKCKRS